MGPALIPLAAGQGVLQVVKEVIPVREVREGIVQCFPEELLPASEVGKRSGKPDGPSILMDRHTPAQHRLVGTVAMLEPMLIRQSIGLSAEVLVNIPLQRGEVVGMNPVKPSGGFFDYIGRTQSDYFVPARRGMETVRNEVPVPQTVVRSVSGQSVSLLAFTQLSLYRFPCGDVAQRHHEGVTTCPRHRSDMHLDYDRGPVSTDEVELGDVIRRP